MTDWLAQGYRAMQPGVFHRVSRYGEKLMLCEVAFNVGAVVPPHAHPHEQISYVVSGKVTFDLAGEKVTLEAGGSCLMPPNAPHGVVCLEEALVLDVFTPLREDFLR
jgi:quercetin dioxygenase-like cupin family protein